MTSMTPGDLPVSLNEVRGWLRLGTTIDDAVIAQLIRAATGICEAFIGQWLIVRAAEETVTLQGGGARLTARPLVGVDQVVLIDAAGVEAEAEPDAWRVVRSRDGSARLMPVAPGAAVLLRATYRAGLAPDMNGVPEAIRQGIVRMTQHMHSARDGEGAAPPAAIAALWQPWRRMTLGSAR